MKNLKILRQNLGISQKACADALGIGKTTLCYYEQGKISPSIDTLKQMADFFGCSIDYLLGHETKGILHLDSFTPLQKQIIEYIKVLNDDQLNILKGMFGTVIGLPLEEVLKKEN